MRHALGIAIALRRHFSVADRNEIGGGRAHIGEERRLMTAGDEGRARMPIRGRNRPAHDRRRRRRKSCLRGRHRRRVSAASIPSSAISATRATPSLRSGKASASSAVIVAALRSAGPSAALASAKARCKVSMPSQSGEAICTTLTIRPASSRAAFRCAPPMSQPMMLCMSLLACDEGASSYATLRRQAHGAKKRAS